MGRHLVGELEREWPGVKLVVWDRPEIDITKPETYSGSLKEEQPEWLVHLAAFAAVGESFKQPELVRKVNVEATGKLLEEAARVSPGTKFLVASSADIYGRGFSTPLPELPLSEARPNSPYAVSKFEMEKIIEADFNDRVIRVRPFPHIGPGQRPGFVTADFALQIAAIEKGEREPVMLVGNLEAQRDFTDVRDVVRAYRLLMERGGLGEVYHVASGKAVSIAEILQKLLVLSRVKIEVKQDPERLRASDVPVLVGDYGKLNRVCGWEPEIVLDKSLKDILDWWRRQ